MEQRLYEKIVMLFVILALIGTRGFAERQGQIQQVTSVPSLTQELPSYALNLDGSREALITDNSSYSHMNALKNPSNDAEDINLILSQVGFESELLLDGSLSEIEAATRSFLDRSKKGGVATSLFFYAGHAVQYEGSNHLIPVDADIKRDNGLLSKAYNMHVLLKGLEPSSAHLIIIDACRDNPFSIIEPYGLEALQLYASTERDYQRFLETVPPFRETREYYVISEDPTEGLTLTRALNIKGVADNAARESVKTEASVMFKTGRCGE